MEPSAILAPIVALVAWTLVMMVWMVVTRYAAMRRKGISLKGRVGTHTGWLDGVIEDHANWKAHNYTHLVEQPTLFYATALTLALLDFGDGINLILAWTYVGLRVLHSLIQATINIVLYRTAVWVLSSLALMALTVQAAIRICSHL